MLFKTYEPDIKAVDLNQGVDSTLIILHYRLAGHHLVSCVSGWPEDLDIEIIKVYGELPLVECYANQLYQVLMNLLSFAIDAVQERASSEMSQQTTNPSETATHYSPTITIRTGVSLDKTRAIIQIADNGSGMTEESQCRLFYPPSIAKPIGKPIEIGLCLSTSHQIVVEKHGGQLKCVSALGEGTEFTIEIPIRQSHQQFS